MQDWIGENQIPDVPRWESPRTVFFKFDKAYEHALEWLANAWDGRTISPPEYVGEYYLKSRGLW